MQLYSNVSMNLIKCFRACVEYLNIGGVQYYCAGFLQPETSICEMSLLSSKMSAFLFPASKYTHDIVNYLLLNRSST